MFGTKAIHLMTALSLTMGSINLAQAQVKKVERPPQFVLLAFDGSFNLEFWKESRGFAGQMRNENKPMDLTYFISGVYWLTEKNYALYMPPHIEAKYPTALDKQAEVQRRLQEANNSSIARGIKNKSRAAFSAIGFGNNQADIAERINQVNLAFEEGHEIASHANGHYSAGTSTTNSKRWTRAQWGSEFDQFNELIFGAYENNNITNTSKYASGYAFGPEDVVGFRAPTLDASPAMFQTLADKKYRYDTSGKNSGAESPTKWPSKDEYGTWILPLGWIKIAGTQKSTVSMDYNFYVVQSHETEDPANKVKYRDQMYESYVKYFNDNYYGNRAPVHIGHHFSKWNGGAYWEAMKQLSNKVCGMKEVRCVTYIEYVKWLDEQSSDQLKAYQTTAFQKIARPADLKSLEIVGNSAAMLKMEDQTFKASAQMDRKSRVLGYRLGLKVNNQLQENNEISLADLRLKNSLGSQAVVSAVVLNKAGDEIHSYSLKIKDLGTETEDIATTSLEETAAMGDMSEAHEHDEDHE